MRILLDTHAFVWWLAGSERLSEAAHVAIANHENAVLVSAASAWEIATKHRLGKLPMPRPWPTTLPAASRTRASKNWLSPFMTANAPVGYRVLIAIPSTVC